MLTGRLLRAGRGSRAGGTRTPNRRFWRPVLCQIELLPSAVGLLGWSPSGWNPSGQDSTGRRGADPRPDPLGQVFSPPGRSQVDAGSSRRVPRPPRLRPSGPPRKPPATPTRLSSRRVGRGVERRAVVRRANLPGVLVPLAHRPQGPKQLSISHDLRLTAKALGHVELSRGVDTVRLTCGDLPGCQRPRRQALERTRTISAGLGNARLLFPIGQERFA